MASREAGIIVLSESGAGEFLSHAMMQHGLDAAWCKSMGEMLRDHPPPTLSVFVIHIDRDRKGPLLVAAGWMALEHPQVQKIAIVGEPLTLPIATYLTACSVEVVRARLEPSEVEHVVSVVSQASQRRAWALSGHACLHRVENT